MARQHTAGDSHRAAPPDAPDALEFDRVTFGYGRLPVLRDVSLRIKAGRFVAIIGPNGSGKSTLMKAGLGLLRPDCGTVRLFGVPLARFDDWGRVGYVPQRANASTAIPVSVEEVVRTGLAGRLGLLRRPDRQQRERIEQVLELMGLTALRREAVGSLSGGQQQRALIARALVTDPGLLVLDEPATGVDADARLILRASLEHLLRTEGVAVVYITHDPEGFAGLADEVYEMRAGAAVPCADPSAHHPHAHALPAVPRTDPGAGPQR